jgi:hypothetical protein
VAQRRLKVETLISGNVESFALIDMRFELTTGSYVVIVVTFAETS